MGEFMTGVLNTSVVVGMSIAAAGILLKISSKRYSAGCRKRIWIFMAFALLIPFHLFRFPGAYTAEIPNVVLREFDSRTANGTGGQGLAEGIGQSGQGQAEQNQASQNQPAQTAQNHAAQNPAQSSGNRASKTELTVADVSFAVWACVGVLLAAWFAAGYWRMRGRIRRWSCECGNWQVQEITREIAAKCKLKRIPEVRVMKDSEEGPFTTGVLKNIIILPDDSLHEKDLRFILKHEMLHCRNNDISWKLLFLTVNIIHWFNPLVWYLRKAAEQDMEIACDEEVVASVSREDRKEYSDVILSWVERSSCKGSAVSTGYVNGVRFLKRRFDSIFNRRKKKNGILLTGGVCILALFTGCALRLQNGGSEWEEKQPGVSTEPEAVPGVDPGEGGADIPDTGEGEIDVPVQKDSNRMQVFTPEELKVIPEIVTYDFESACEKGEVRQLRGVLPGTGEGMWYTIAIDGVEYYYGRYDFSPDRTEVFGYGYAIVGGNYSLANGISVGMTKSELLAQYPDLRIEDPEGNVLSGIGSWTWWNNGAYPRSYKGMDEDWDYGGTDYYHWDSQFDYIMIAEMEQPLDTLPIAVALMMKGDIVSAITFYYPTAD